MYIGEADLFDATLLGVATFVPGDPRDDRTSQASPFQASQDVEAQAGRALSQTSDHVET